MARRAGKRFKIWEEALAYRNKHDLEVIIEIYGAQTGITYLVPWQPKPKAEDKPEPGKQYSLAAKARGKTWADAEIPTTK